MKYWRIHITEWGTLYGIGTEAEAYEWYRHKKEWEGCGGNIEEIPKAKAEKMKDVE